MTVVTPGAVTIANVTVDSCEGTTEMSAPAGVLKSVAIARTISPSTSAYSAPMPLAVAVAGQPGVENGVAGKNPAAGVMAFSAPPTAASPVTTNDVICESPPSH